MREDGLGGVSEQFGGAPGRETFTVAVTLTAKPEHAAEFGRRLLADVEANRLDEGCIIFDVHRLRDEPNSWFLYEGWRSKADSDAHIAKPHVKAFMEDWDRLLATPPDLVRLDLKSKRTEPRHDWS